MSTFWEVMRTLATLSAVVFGVAGLFGYTEADTGVTHMLLLWIVALLEGQREKREAEDPKERTGHTEGALWPH